MGVAQDVHFKEVSALKYPGIRVAKQVKFNLE